MDYKGYVISRIVKIAIITIIILLLLAGVAFFISLFSMKPAYEDVNLHFAAGGIGDDGSGRLGVVYEDYDAIYSKNEVKCTGFRIESKFDTAVDYEVHFYTADDIYIGYIVENDLSLDVPPKAMPVLGAESGGELEIDSETGKVLSGTPVLDEDGEEIPAASIRIVLRPMGSTGDGYFKSVAGWLNILRFDSAFTLQVTQSNN